MLALACQHSQLNRREIFRQWRNAALADWRQLAAWSCDLPLSISSTRS